MDKISLRRNIILYKLFILFDEPMFWGPILIISLQKLGKMSLPEIYFMEAAVMIICVVLEVPSGALADLIGNKKTIIIGRIILWASIICFAFMNSPEMAWTGNILWALGYSIQSGAEQSLFYNSLKVRGAEKLFKKIEGCAVGSRLLVMAFTSLTVGYLAEINIRIPLYLCIPFAGIPLVVAFFFKESASTRKYSAGEQFRLIREGFRFAASKREVCWIIGFCTLIGGASKLWFFTYNPYFEKVNISLGMFGPIFFCLNIVAWLSSHYTYTIEKKLTEKGCVIMMIICTGAPIVIMGLLPFPPCASLVVLQNIVRGIIRPFKSDYINRHIESDHIRTTVLSVQSATSEAMSIVSLALFGGLIGLAGLTNSLVILGVLVLGFGYLSFLKYGRIKPSVLY